MELASDFLKISVASPVPTSRLPPTMALNTGSSEMNVLLTCVIVSGGKCGMKYLSPQKTAAIKSRQTMINAKGQR